MVFAPDPTGGAYSAPPDPVAGSKKSYFKRFDCFTLQNEQRNAAAETIKIHRYLISLDQPIARPFMPHILAQLALKLYL